MSPTPHSSPSPSILDDTTMRVASNTPEFFDEVVLDDNHESSPPPPPFVLNDDEVSDSNNNTTADRTVWPIMVSIWITLWLVFPTLVVAMMVTFLLIGQAWLCMIFALHLTLDLWKVRIQIQNIATSSQQQPAEAVRKSSTMGNNRNQDEEFGGSEQETTTIFEESSITTTTSTIGGGPSGREGTNHQHGHTNLIRQCCNCCTSSSTRRVFTTFTSLLDVLLFGLLYPILMNVFNDFFVDIDDTVVVEWTHYYYTFQVLQVFSWFVVVGRLLVGSRIILLPWIMKMTSNFWTTNSNNNSNNISLWIPSVLRNCVEWIQHLWFRFTVRWSRPPEFVGWWKLTVLMTIVSFLVMGWTMFLTILHVGSIEQMVVVATPNPNPDGPYDPTAAAAASASSSPPHYCDPLDESECVLPFPSSHYLKRDKTTPSGYRVNFRSNSFPPLKGRREFSVDFLNRMDGFSTMGPLLFHLDGLMESHDAYLQQKEADGDEESVSTTTTPTTTRLRGNDELHLSTTPYSATLLLDIDNQQLVPHSAEIDYLDAPERPVVMVFPAKPLNHNTHYALAVINATDVNGNRLQPTNGMKTLLLKNHDDNENRRLSQEDDEEPAPSRYEVFVDAVLPALEIATTKAASTTGNNNKKKKNTASVTGWGGHNGAFSWKDDPEAVQLLFDFRTISRESQLGTVESVRDATLAHLEDTSQSNGWWSEQEGEENHVRVIQQQEGDCTNPLYPIARTLHLELDVPWFLAEYGPGFRGATIDATAVELGVPTTIGQAKAVVHIPCSLKQAALEETCNDTTTNTTTEAQPLRAVVEYGHGLFGSRMEAGDAFLIKMAHDNGYMIVAMDWRGMSKYDFPLLARTMLEDPSMFESVRDNLIQGYANKFALQHFVHNGLLDKDWLQFTAEEDGESYKIPRLLQQEEQQQEDSNDTTISSSPQEPTSLIDDQVPFIFYGNSQGGILGAGYVGLSGETGFISRAVLGVPGTSFSFIIARSLAFVGYNLALLTNFYNGRHVRIFLSLAQMCWDSVEAAGVLAGVGGGVSQLNNPTTTTTIPPILIQTGLGDAVVPAVSAERLARAFGAQILPSNPRTSIFGIPTTEMVTTNTAGAEAEPTASSSGGVTLQEILYEQDYDSLPASNAASANHNDVHNCVRLDPALKVQVAEFINSGNVIDPCGLDGADCIRPKALYNKSPMKFTDLFNTERDVPGPHQVQVCNA